MRRQQKKALREAVRQEAIDREDYSELMLGRYRGGDARDWHFAEALYDSEMGGGWDDDPYSEYCGYDDYHGHDEYSFLDEESVDFWAYLGYREECESLYGRTSYMNAAYAIHEEPAE